MDWASNSLRTTATFNAAVDVWAGSMAWAPGSHVVSVVVCPATRGWQLPARSAVHAVSPSRIAVDASGSVPTNAARTHVVESRVNVTIESLPQPSAISSACTGSPSVANKR